MALSDIRAAVKTIIEGVADVGAVYEYLRYSNDWTKFLTLFKQSDSRIRGWMITRKATPSRRDTMPTLTREHEIKIIGIYGIEDAEASELVFQDLVEALQDAFDSNNTLNGTVVDSGPLQVDLVEPREFGGAACHYAELSLKASERRRYT